MRVLFYIFLAALIGLLAGGWSALRLAGVTQKNAISSSFSVSVDGWQSDWSIGSKASGPYLRARIARHGLLALAKEEAVYFTRTKDSEGRALSEACSYRLSGTSQSAQWWSITLYDADSRLPLNEDNALSIDASKTGYAAQWDAEISSRRQTDRDWISSRNAGIYDLTLRLYRPSAELIVDPEKHLSPPQIERLSCDGDAS